MYVSTGYLESAGKQKGKIYHLKGIEVPTPDNDAGKSISFVTSPSAAQLSLFGSEVPNLNSKDPDLNSKGPDLTPDQHDSFDERAQSLWSELKKIANPIAQLTGRKKSKAIIEQTLIELCQAAEPQCLKLVDIANLLDMKPDTLRRNYLSQMVKQQQLYLVYPTIPNHPEQGYTTQNNSKQD